MITEIVFGLASAAFLVVLYFKWTYGYWKRKNVPYIAPAIPWGTDDNILERKTPLSLIIKDNYDELKSKGHAIGGVYLVNRPGLLLVDPDVIRKVISKDFQVFSGHGFHKMKKRPPLLHNLFSMDAAEWRIARQQLTPTFTSGKMKMMFDTLLRCTQPMIDHVNVLHDEGKSLDIKEILACFSTDVIGSCAFGVECDSFKGPDSEFRRHGRNMLVGSGPGSLTKLILRYLATEGYLPIRSPTMDFFEKVFKDIFRYRKDNSVQRNDFVQLLLEMQRKAIEQGQDLTEDQLAAHAYMFFLAGFETSSTTTCFCLFELAFNLDVQEKLRREIQDTLKRHDGKLTYDAVVEMKYMQMVIDETLRKYPPGAVANRESNASYKMEETGTVIDKGTLILVSVLGLHRDPEYWPDPLKFDPERFTEEKKAQRHPFIYMPFGEGPRLCIGMRFALMQIKVALSYLLTNFVFSPHKSMPYNMEYHLDDVVLSFKDNVILNVQKIKN